MAILDNAIWLTGSAGTAQDGTTTITEGGNSTTIEAGFTENAWDASQSGYAVSEFGAFGITKPITAKYAFSNPVEDLSFSFQHVNSQGSTYDDQFTIYAYDENGDLLDSADVIAGLSGLDQDIYWVNGDGSVTIEGEGRNSNDIELTLPGQISGLAIIFDAGEDGTRSGGAGLSDFTFTIPPEAALDDLVQGTEGDDVIDANYEGDPQGDRVDNDDSTGDLTGNPGSDDDYIKAYGGDDTVKAGDGNDEVYGGAGNDKISGGAGMDELHGNTGNDTIYGDGGSDVIYGEDGNDTLYGGGGGDSITGGDGNDTINGNNGADKLVGDGGDDTFVLTGKFGNDQIVGGETDEKKGDTLDLSDLKQDTKIDLTSENPENGTVSDGASTAKFQEIENIVLGGGRDTIVLADKGGADVVYSFDMTDSGDGSTNDQLDVSGMTSDGGTTPVNTGDVVVKDTNGDGTGDAILIFPGGESITLVGVLPSQVDSGAELRSIGIPCFTPGTGILTLEGEVPIEALKVGDLIWTVENGLQPLRWIGKRHLDKVDLARHPEFRPIVLASGVFGNRGNLVVSPQHGMMIEADGVRRLIRAKHAAEFLGKEAAWVDQEVDQVTYIHLMFDSHQLIYADGAETEAFYPGKSALLNLDQPALAEVLGLFPDLGRTLGGAAPEKVYGNPAKDYLNRREAGMMAAGLLQ